MFTLLLHNIVKLKTKYLRTKLEHAVNLKNYIPQRGYSPKSFDFFAVDNDQVSPFPEYTKGDKSSLVFNAADSSTASNS